jgi:transposase-like protein
MARKKMGRRYSTEQKLEVIRRVQGGESQKAVANDTGISSWTIGYWVRGAKAGRNPGRPRATQVERLQAARASRRAEEIAWALDGDVLVVRIPLRQFVRQLARRALERI